MKLFPSESYFAFFFQAEDGIRDGHVTGVQTCALPISPGEEGGECDDECDTCGGSILRGAPSGEVEVYIPPSEDVALYPYLLGVGLDIAECGLRRLFEDIAELTGQLDLTFTR